MVESLVQLLDLCDELLLTIFKKLSKVQVLYSLFGINERLNQIVRDLDFTCHLTLLTWSSNRRYRCLTNRYIPPLEDVVLVRFYSQILPYIHHKIQWLDLESSSMERILLAAYYPNLSGLGLYNIKEETAAYIFNDESSVVQQILKKQISSLVITIINDAKQPLMTHVINIIFTSIVNTCTNLRYLNFAPHLSYRRSLNLEYPKFICSTLQELHVNLDDFGTCLYLLDGRFHKLETFIVNIIFSGLPNTEIPNEENLPNMKCFSLNVDSGIRDYERLIVPILKRMSNLEELALYMMVDCEKRFIDGNSLKENISHMKRLKKFMFNIQSTISLDNEIDLLSNADIQQTFLTFINQVISCVDYFSNKKRGQCHIYSYPYTSTSYHGITSNLPGGLFECVREISLYDERPFEHEFFLQIAQAFPFLKMLSLTNKQPQNDKHYQKSNVDNEKLLIIEYPYLIALNLINVHDDYIVQFLDDRKTCFPSTFGLAVDGKSLKRVTHNFTIDTMRDNCDKVTDLCILDTLEICECLKNYFSRAHLD